MSEYKIGDIISIVLTIVLFYSINGNAAQWTCISRWAATCNTWKMEVPGGWLVSGEGYGSGEYAMAFVPDIKHEWKE